MKYFASNQASPRYDSFLGQPLYREELFKKLNRDVLKKKQYSYCFFFAQIYILKALYL
jgi:hypothetical protein